jgi:hypothetical protein
VGNRSPLILSAVVVSLGQLLLSAADAQRTPGPVPLRASLEVPLQTWRLKVGAPVLASVETPWSGAGCQLKTGATVYGTVTGVTSKLHGAPESSLKLLFDKADCTGHRATPIHLILYALVNDAEDETRERQEIQSTLGFSTLNPYNSTNMTTLVSLGNGAKDEAANLPAFKRGEVTGAGKTTLTVGNTVDMASELHSVKKDISIYAKAELILLAPEPKAAAPKFAESEKPGEPAAAATAVEAEAPGEAMAHAAPAAPRPAPEVEVCTAGGCDSREATVAADTRPADKATRFVPLRHLGYSPRRYIEMAAFDYDTAIHYLSPRQALITFDAHRLRWRAGGTWPARVTRTVRAVLIDTETGRTLRVVEWTVDGIGPYTWPAGPGAVLVHTGGTLKLIGAGLATKAVLPADGDLLWVSSSPSGRRVAFALVRERHTRQVHEQIVSLTSMTPEEDVEVRVLSSDGKLLQTREETSNILPPVMTDQGSEISMVHAGSSRWKLAEVTPSGPRAIATLGSRCQPFLTPMPQGSLFVVGCGNNVGRWYRLLDSKGRTLTRGPASDVQVEQAAASAEGVYAVRVVELYKPPGADFRFAGESMADEQISVHRSAGGQALVTAKVENFPETHSSFALSPDSRQLAVLTSAGVSIYEVPGQRASTPRKP